MKIYDTDGTERDAAWLHDTFGAGVQFSTRPFGDQPGYEVTELRAKEGPCTIVARVLNAAGTPAAGVPVARWWNDPTLPALPDGLDYWRTRGVNGDTNSQGDIGFGMGTGDGYDPDWPLDGLPVSEVWAWGNSGRVHGLGWVWGTNHLHLDVTFRYVTSVEPPGEPEIKAELQAIIGHLQAILDLL